MILAAILVQPHPMTFYIYVFFRLCDNVVNHAGNVLPLTICLLILNFSGLKNQFYVELLALKFLPFRASAGHYVSSCIPLYL